jgi:L-amino acid N-acyltransferase YncA
MTSRRSARSERNYVRTGVATFELTPPDRSEWWHRFDAVTGAGLPFLTATLDGEVAGCAYCAPWKTRPAYRHTGFCRTRIVCGWPRHRRTAARATVREVIAVIVDADGAASLALHRNRGFVDAGRLTSVEFSTADGWTPCCCNGAWQRKKRATELVRDFPPHTSGPRGLGQRHDPSPGRSIPPRLVPHSPGQRLRLAP